MTRENETQAGSELIGSVRPRRRDFILSIDFDDTLKVDPRDPSAIIQNLRDQLEEAIEALETCADPTCGLHVKTVAQNALDRINRLKQAV